MDHNHCHNLSIETAPYHTTDLLSNIVLICTQYVRHALYIFSAICVLYFDCEPTYSNNACNAYCCIKRHPMQMVYRIAGNFGEH